MNDLTHKINSSGGPPLGGRVPSSSMCTRGLLLRRRGRVLPWFCHNSIKSMVDVSFDLEKYNGYWDQQGVHRADPAGSDLRQYRLNLGYGQRFSPRWQASIVVPYVWNSNTYSGFSSRTAGLGDTTMNLWYEALNDESAWKVREPQGYDPLGH